MWPDSQERFQNFQRGAKPEQTFTITDSVGLAFVQRSHTSQEALLSSLKPRARCLLLPLLHSCQTPNPDSLKLKPTLLRLILKSLKLKAASVLNSTDPEGRVARSRALPMW